MIINFRGRYAFLSNFWPWEGQRYRGNPIVIEYEDMFFPSVEHAFQAAKTHDRSLRIKISKSFNPGNAKYHGRSLKLRKDWEEVKYPIMQELVRLKFLSEEEWADDLLEQLVETHPSKLFEGNDHGDDLWGVVWNEEKGFWEGKNWLGVILMGVRKEAIDG
jgi:ribA/ribD-fused uncharacterized protein